MQHSGAPIACWKSGAPSKRGSRAWMRWLQLVVIRNSFDTRVVFTPVVGTDFNGTVYQYRPQSSGRIRDSHSGIELFTHMGVWDSAVGID